MFGGVVETGVAEALARVVGSEAEGGVEGVSPTVADPVMQPAVPNTTNRRQRRNAIRMVGLYYPAGIRVV